MELHVGEEGAPAMRKAASLVVDRIETVHTVRLETRFARGGNHYLEGECQSSGLLKTYRLDRLRKVLKT